MFIFIFEHNFSHMHLSTYFLILRNSTEISHLRESKPVLKRWLSTKYLPLEHYSIIFSDQALSLYNLDWLLQETTSHHDGPAHEWPQVSADTQPAVRRSCLENCPLLLSPYPPATYRIVFCHQVSLVWMVSWPASNHWYQHCICRGGRDRPPPRTGTVHIQDLLGWGQKRHQGRLSEELFVFSLFVFAK